MIELAARRRLDLRQPLKRQVRECCDDLWPSLTRELIAVFPDPNGARPAADLLSEDGCAALLVDDGCDRVTHDDTLPKVTSRRKGKITHGNVTQRNVGAMQHDAGWQEQTEGWQRLRWARKRWQSVAGAVNASAKDAAESLGMKDGTYRAYERKSTASKSTKLDSQAAIKFGRRFGVSWVWLLTGDGTPFDDPTALPQDQERAVRALSQMTEEEQKAFADFLEARVGDKRRHAG